MRRASRDKEAAVELTARLRARRPEIEQETMDHVLGLSALPESGEPEYLDGLRSAVAAAIDHAISDVEGVEDGRSPVPDELLAQARRAARMKVGLDTVLRRYVAGQNLLSDFFVQEAEGLVTTAELKRTLRRLAAVMDPVLIAVAAVYKEEADASVGGSQSRRLELVEGLLAGKPLDSQQLGYDLGSHHLGLVASGAGSDDTLRTLAASLDANLLLLNRTSDIYWAWLGRPNLFDVDDVVRRADKLAGPSQTLVIGESAVGLSGWRLSHRQASAGISVASRLAPQVVRYADVAVLSSLIRDDLLKVSLRRIYLEPLDDGYENGAVLRKTLRTYFSAGRNGASTASALGVSRQTITHRLRKVEERIGRPLTASSLELEVALMFDMSHTI
jgi:PucR C-terminal helix-turn-helix domain/GGDEF-like domain